MLLFSSIESYFGGEPFEEFKKSMFFERYLQWKCLERSVLYIYNVLLYSVVKTAFILQATCHKEVISTLSSIRERRLWRGWYFCWEVGIFVKQKFDILIVLWSLRLRHANMQSHNLLHALAKKCLNNI